MALMFPRLAHNFVKNGYFPTDELSIERILGMIKVSKQPVHLLDPCCGEGWALAELAHYCKQFDQSVFSAGIEYDVERAAHAKTMLDHVVHADIDLCVIGQAQFNVLFLNPPYGDRIHAQQLSLDKNDQGKDRLEKHFLNRTLPTLCFGGLLIYIIPNYILDKHLARQLARSLSDISVYRLPEDRFKQVVIMGYRKRSDATGTQAIVEELMRIGADRNEAAELPIDAERHYPISGIVRQRKGAFELRTVHLTADQVNEVIDEYPCLWPDFQSFFKQRSTSKRRPARKLSDWHLALMLAAGQISGVIESKDGQRLLIKGSTYKEKETSSTFEENDDGEVIETHTATDRFVPVIKGIDLTANSQHYGDVITIK